MAVAGGHEPQHEKRGGGNHVFPNIGGKPTRSRGGARAYIRGGTSQWYCGSTARSGRQRDMNCSTSELSAHRRGGG